MKRSLMYLLPVLFVGIHSIEAQEPIINYGEIENYFKENVYGRRILTDDQLVAMVPELIQYRWYIQNSRKVFVVDSSKISNIIIDALLASIGIYDTKPTRSADIEETLQLNFERNLKKLTKAFDMAQFFKDFPKTGLVLVKQFSLHLMNTAFKNFANRSAFNATYYKIESLKNAFLKKDGKERKGLSSQLSSTAQEYCKICQKIITNDQLENRFKYQFAQNLAAEYLTQKSILSEEEVCIFIGMSLESISNIPVESQPEKLFRLLLDKKVTDRNLEEIFSRIPHINIQGKDPKGYRSNFDLNQIFRSRYNNLKASRAQTRTSKK